MDDATQYRLALRASALAYVAKGWAVVPLSRMTYDAQGRKQVRRLIRWQRDPDQLVRTPEQVERWFGLTGQAEGLAIATGPSGLLAVDVDSHKASYGGAEPPPGGWREQHAGRGGIHVYYANPDGQRNTAGALGTAVDTRGDGGLMYAAPTRCYHADGRVTQWQTERPLSELPAPGELPPGPAVADRRRDFRPVVAGEVHEPTVKPREEAFGIVAAKRAEWLASVQGTRHATLMDFGGTLARVLLADGLAPHEVYAQLDDEVAAHPDAAEFETAEKDIQDCVRYAMVNPWVFGAPTGLEARFAPPDPGQALGGQDWNPEGDDPDALTQSDYDGEFIPPEPTLLDLGWTLPLMYSGTTEDPRCNTIFGAPGSAKTWLAQLAAVQVAESGGRVWIVDYENSRPSYVARMKALGLSRTAIGRITYTRASQEPADQVHARLAAAASGRYGLVVLDGMNAALSSMGADENKTGEVTRWYQRYIAGIPTIVVLDHVAKNADGLTRRTAIGSQAKEAVLSGVAWFVEKLRSFGTGGGQGVLRLTMGKDRPGGLEGRVRGDELLVDVRVEPGGKTVALAVRTLLGDAVSPEEAVFRAMLTDGVPLGLTQRDFQEEFKPRNGGVGVGKGRIAAVMKRYEEYVIEAERPATFITDREVTDA